MSTLYTSYETSLSLRDAGAEQGHVETLHWCATAIGGQRLVRHFWCDLAAPLDPTDHHPRAFRSDEIIEALGDRLDKIERESSWWTIHYYAGENWEDKKALGDMDEPLVEALAQAWLAVLKEGK